MQCNKCGYEPTMAEIQANPNECPNCARIAAQRPAVAQAGPAIVQMSPAVKKAVFGYDGAHAVVVVDLQMSFSSMVWFMVKLALASIPAMLILFVIMSMLVAAFFGLSVGSAVLSSFR